jgi:hypothetical protein
MIVAAGVITIMNTRRPCAQIAVDVADDGGEDDALAADAGRS